MSTCVAGSNFDLGGLPAGTNWLTVKFSLGGREVFEGQIAGEPSGHS